MKYTTQFPIEQLSGKDGFPGGLVYAKSAGLLVARRFVIPNNPDTANQQTVRTALTVVAQNFKNLSDAQRAGWTAWAQEIPETILGQEVTLGDMAVYARSDFPYYIVNTAHMTDAPTAMPGFAALTMSSLAYNSGTTTFSFDFTHNGVATVGRWRIRVTDSLASAQRMARPTDFRLAVGPAAASYPAVAASAQTFSTAAPVFSWSNGDWVEVGIAPIGADWSVGNEVTFRDQITVT